MKDEKFIPNQVLEFDIMKSLLDDFFKLEFFIGLFGNGEDFWKHQMDIDLYEILYNEYLMLHKQDNFIVETFYKDVLNKFQLKYPEYDIETYTDFYGQNFSFYRTISKYVDYLNREKIIHSLNILKLELEKSDTNSDLIMLHLNNLHVRLKELILK